MNGIKIAEFKNVGLGLLSTVYQRGAFEFAVSLCDTDVNECVGVKPFATCDAATDYARRCVDDMANIGPNNWMTFAAVSR